MVTSSKRCPPRFRNMRLGDDAGETGITGSQVEVQPAVVVQVAEVGTHGLHGDSQVPLLDHVPKAASAVPLVEAGLFEIRGESETVTGLLTDMTRITGDEQVQVAVVVVIPEPDREALLGTRHLQLGRDVLEGSVSPVPVEPVRIPVVGDVQVRIAVSIVVSPGDPLGVGVVPDAGLRRHVPERCRPPRFRNNCQGAR